MITSPLCANCGIPLHERRQGRPRQCCSDACRQALHRRRLAADAASYPMATGDLDDILEELVKDLAAGLNAIQRDLRTTAGTGTGVTPTALADARQLAVRIEDLTAGLVGQARLHRTPWAQIAAALAVSEDTARHRFRPHDIERRLARLRRRTAPAAKATGPGARVPAPGERSAPAPPLPEPADRPAVNRLAPVLSRLVRATGRSQRAVSDASGLSASYLSRILAGGRIPTWRLTEAIALACDADPKVLRELWEAERLREFEHRTAPNRPGTRTQPHPPTTGSSRTRAPKDDPAAARTALQAALSTLHLRAGRPSHRRLAAATDYRLTQDRISTILDGTTAVAWDDLAVLVDVLAGERAYFQPLHAAATGQGGAEGRSTPSPALRHAPESIMSAADHRAQILHRRARAARVEQTVHPEAAEGCGIPDPRSAVPRQLDPETAKANMIAKNVWPISPWPTAAKPWLSVCMDCGQYVTPIYRNVMQPGRGGCEPCGRARAVAKRKVPAHVALAELRAKGVEPLTDYPGIDVPWPSQCRSALCPGLWQGQPADISPRLSDARLATISACKYCAGIAIRPERAVYEMIQRGVQPLAPYRKATTPWPCRCLTCRAEVSPTYANVVLNGQGGCLPCSGRARVSEAQAHAEMLAAGARPLEPYPGVNKHWRSLCLAPHCPGPTDRLIHPRLGWIRRGAQACKWCAGVVIDPDTAHDIMLEAGLQPLQPYPGVREPWRCRCTNPACQAIVHPTLGSVNSRGTGCFECADYGFKRERPAQVYLLTHEGLGAAKIGICNLNTGRIQKHQGQGWQLHATLDFPLGRDAARLEREVLAEWRAQNWKPVRDHGRTYDGWTETVPVTADASREVLWEGVVQLHNLLAHSKTSRAAA
ncbi:helix-turn-helix domain-containing protein [Kitasatospora sp. LaBMicrA B282]|uniref:helix-turn-helix domain-containing protein n=1 Tax=Kitasatospora sp. LaBMicrA B282 TaxID=3420949 RepID=UPI003D0A1385